MRFKTANEKHHLKVAQRPLLSRFGMHALNAISAIMTSSKPVSYIPQPPRLVDQRREALRFNQHSLRTQEASLYWLKFFVRWYGRSGRARHSREWGATTGVELLRAQLI